MSKSVAVMDLGTNTFHLLIAEWDGLNFREIVKRVDPVKLGEGGIEEGKIKPEAFERGLGMMNIYAGQIRDCGVSELRAIATSAIRSAKNGQEFVERVKQETGIAIEIIDGEQEAMLIYKGVRLSGCLTDQHALIMDIGGGSIEFIICNKQNVFWKQSFEIGAARLMQQFHQTDPIPAASVDDLYSYLDKQLKPLFEASTHYPLKYLVGSSGAFETFAELDHPEFDPGSNNTYHFESGRLQNILTWIRQSTHEERAARKEISPVRVDMLVTAAIVSNYMIQKLGIQLVLMTTSSLKEGVLADWLNEK